MPRPGWRGWFRCRGCRVWQAVYLCVFSDYGYVHDPGRNLGNSRLANAWLFSTGAGLDVVTFYNVVLRLNYALNRQGDRGFFFNFASDI